MPKPMATHAHDSLAKAIEESTGISGGENIIESEKSKDQFPVPSSS